MPGRPTSSTSASASDAVGDFDGKVVVITGAASFVGEAIGADLIDGGASVVLADRDADHGRGGREPARRRVPASSRRTSSQRCRPRPARSAAAARAATDGSTASSARPPNFEDERLGQRPRAVGSGPRRQRRVRRDADDEGGGGHAAGRRDRPHRLGQRSCLAAGAGRLQRLEGRAADAREELGAPPRPAAHPGQRGVAGLDVEPQHRAPLRHPRAGRRPGRGVPAARPDGRSARRWPTRSRSCCRTARRS